MMDISNSISSQESLPLSQESFNGMWQAWNGENNNIINAFDIAELQNYLEDDIEFCKVEDSESNQMERPSDNPVVPASTSSTGVREYTSLNIHANGLSTIPENCAVDEWFAEKAALSQKAHGSNIPPNTDWPGDYDFKISFEPQEKATKCTSWTYSEMKEKLYVNMNIPCPVNIHVETKPPPGSIIRAMTIFSRSEHITDVARRCLNHSVPTDPLNADHPAPSHLIRCDNTSTEYVEDRITKRQSVIAPYEHPQAGMKHTVYLYRFMCLGSCVGGLNRRPLKLIFTLENDGHCLGRKVMDLRICACPGRDKRTDEKQFEKQELKRSSSHSNLNPDEPLLKKQKSDSGDEDSHFTLIVKRRSHYELLKKLKDALELSGMLTAEESAVLRQRRRIKSVSSVGTKLPAPVRNSSNSFPADSVDSWLYSIGMIAYVDSFKSCGYTCMEQLNTFREEDLKKMRIGSLHKAKILKALLEYQENIPRSLKYP